MPYALPPSLVRAEDVIEYTVADSQPVDPAGRKVNGERYIHGEIYKARPDVQAVIHSHSQAVIPFSVAGVALRPVVVQAGFLPLETPNFEIRDARGNERGMQITNIARGAALAKTLGNAPVALMRGHGNVVVGTSVKQATVYAVYADINARMQAAALALKTLDRRHERARAVRSVRIRHQSSVGALSAENHRRRRTKEHGPHAIRP